MLDVFFRGSDPTRPNISEAGLAFLPGELAARRLFGAPSYWHYLQRSRNVVIEWDTPSSFRTIVLGCLRTRR